MEKDTVILSLNDYNELREFKEQILKGKILVVIDNRASYQPLKRYYTEIEVLKDLERIIANLENERDQLSKHNSELSKQNRALLKNVVVKKTNKFLEFFKKWQ